MEVPSFFKSAPVIEPATSNGADLSDEEAAELARCVLVVNNGLAAYVEAEKALKKIRDRQLYRQHFKSFEEFADAELTLGVLFTSAGKFDLGQAALPAGLRNIRGDQAQTVSHDTRGRRASRSDEGLNSAAAGTNMAAGDSIDGLKSTTV